MNNLCLPMKVINISQHSGGSYSHPNGALDLCGSDTGIDFAFAMGDYWKCIGGPWGSHTFFFTACDVNGNPVKVHCADGVDRIVTVAMTHAWFLYVKEPTKGRIYKNGEALYEEGTYSANPDVHITGNHIHFEVAAGVQDCKYWDSNMQVYRMYNELKPEDVCFICDSFSTVANMGGVTMKHCEGIPYTTPQTTIVDGSSIHTFGAQDIHLYKQSGNERIGIVSCEYGKVCNMLDVYLPGKKIKSIVNASYFMMGNGGFLGRVQGFLNGTNNHIDARPVSPAEKGLSGDKPFMDLVVTKKGNISFGDFNSWDYPIEEVVFGVSPAGIEISEFAAVDKYSPECGRGKITTPNRQTMLMRCSDGSFVIGVVAGKLAPIPDLRTWGLVVGLNHLSVYDSGGSTQMAVNGKIVVESTDNPDRKCPVWFVIYEDEEEPVDPFPTDAIGVIHCQSSGLNIRKSIRGEIVHTIRRGETCELLEFIDGIQADGYQWVKVRSGNIHGYAQFDSHVLWIELN